MDVGRDTGRSEFFYQGHLVWRDGRPVWRQGESLAFAPVETYDLNKSDPVTDQQVWGGGPVSRRVVSRYGRRSLRRRKNLTAPCWGLFAASLMWRCVAVLTFTNCMLTDGAQTCHSVSSPLPFSPHLFSPLHPSLFLLSSISLTRCWYGKNARSEASNNGSTKSRGSSMPRVVVSRPTVFPPSSHIAPNGLSPRSSKRVFCSNSLVLLKGDGGLCRASDVRRRRRRLSTCSA